MDQATLDMAREWLETEGEDYDDARLLAVAEEMQSMGDHQDAIDRGDVCWCGGSRSRPHSSRCTDT